MVVLVWFNTTVSLVMEELRPKQTPVKIFDKGIKNIILVITTLVHKEDGRVWGMGYNYRQLGNGRNDRKTPVKIFDGY